MHKPTKSQEEITALFKQDLVTGVGKSVKHDSAPKHVTGEAVYVDDRLEFPNQLHVYARMSDRAHARIISIDTSPCYQIPGVAIAITAKDVPGQLDIGAVLPGDPLLADGKVEFVGQPVIAVAADSLETARKAAMAAIIEYEDLEPVLDVVDALRKQHFVLDSHTHKRGDSASALATAPRRLQGTLHIGGQEHFYLETQVSSVMPTEDGGMIVYTSTQNPTEVQKLVAEVLGVSMNKIVIDMRRMGGGFGGKETQAAGPACMCAVIAHLTGRPTKMRLPRMEDMTMTGKRHPFYVEYDVGFDDDGLLHGIEIDLAGNCGYSPDLSGSIVDRAMFHSDNAYYLGDVTIHGHRCKTNTASNTAYRGFGGPQGMVAIEEIMDAIARELGKDPLEIRKRNYYGKTERNVTPYYQTVEHNMLDEMTAELEASSDKALERNTDTRALGSLGLVYTPGDSWSLRANLAQGYSYPTLQQLFLTTTAGGQTTVGNPELLPEKANTVELGARYRDGRLTLDATLFHTRAEDYIGQEVDNTSGPQPIRRYVNIHQATTTGLELFGEHRLTATDTAFYLSGSVLRREYDFGESQTYDSGTPRLAGRLGVRQEWMPASAMRLEGDLFLRGESEVRERNAAGELTSRTAGFGTLNAYLGLQYADRLDVGLSLDNLLDKRYRSFGELTGEERSVTLTTTLHF